MKNLIFIGKPGSGKGTISSLLKDMGYNHISTGDILREEISKGTDLGKRISALIDNGNFVPDEMAVELTKVHTDLNTPTVFDGFPRTQGQAILFNQEIPNLKYTVIHFKLSDNEIVERLSNRRSCSKCKTIYNLKNLPPKISNICDNCGNVGLIHRKDDYPEIINQRLKIYNETFDSLLQYFEGQGVVKTVDANLNAKEVFSQVKEIIKNL